MPKRDLSMDTFIDALRASWMKRPGCPTLFEIKWRTELVRNVCIRTGWSAPYILNMLSLPVWEYTEQNLRKHYTQNKGIIYLTPPREENHEDRD